MKPLLYYNWVMRRMIAVTTVLLLLAVGVPTNAQDYPLAPGWFDDDWYYIDYVGTWNSHVDHALCVDGNVTSTTTAGSHADFSLWGGGFVLHSIQTGIPGGNFDICIDEVCVNYVHYAASPASLALEFSGLDYGTHDVELWRQLGPLYVCAIAVLPPPPQPTQPPPPLVVEVTVEVTQEPLEITVVPLDMEEPQRQHFMVDDLGGTPQVFAMNYEMTLGDILLGILLMVLACLGMLALVLRFLEERRNRE